MTAGTPHAYALPCQIAPNGTDATTFLLQFEVVAGDGINPPLALTVAFTYDATQSAATNLAGLKAAIVTGAAGSGLPGLTTSNVLVFTAVN